MSEFAGRTALVTGASDGIGLEIARALAAGGARVLLPVRNRAKGERVAAQIRHHHPAAKLDVCDLDLARLDTVAALTAQLRHAGEPIDMLVLNAGVVQLGVRDRTTTPDGFELTFQTNFLGHAALTLGLLPLLQARRARVVVQCSLAAAGGRVCWGDLRGERSYRPYRAYRSSKTALGLFGVELARRSAAAGWGVSVQLCHPGVAPGSAIAPSLRALLPQPLVRWGVRHLGNPPHEAARTALAALTAPATPTAPASRAPRFFVPAGIGELGGHPKERTPYRSLLRAGDARMVWHLAERFGRVPTGAPYDTD